MAQIIGITADRFKGRYLVGEKYAACVASAGGLPVILPPLLGHEEHFIELCDGFVFSGGDDPVMEQWGIETHQAATPCDKKRQQFETSLLEHLAGVPEKPVLGVCLGMQLMGLIAGGVLEQDLEPKYAELHRDGNHQVFGELGEGEVHSSHHQALTESGSLKVIATAEDGIIEAVQDLGRNWCIGVQWHPERTCDPTLGQGLFDQLCGAVTT
jgi:putative glutamine amidotransferase